MGIVRLRAVTGRAGGDSGGCHSILGNNHVSSTANGSERASRREAMISARRHSAADQVGSRLLLWPAVASDPPCWRGERKLALINMRASFAPMPPRSGTDRRQLNDPHQ